MESKEESSEAVKGNGQALLMVAGAGTVAEIGEGGEAGRGPLRKLSRQIVRDGQERRAMESRGDGDSVSGDRQAQRMVHPGPG